MSTSTRTTIGAFTVTLRSDGSLVVETASLDALTVQPDSSHGIIVREV